MIPFPPDLLDLAETLESIRAAHDLPGFGLAIVRDGEVVVQIGLGVRQVGEPTPVTDTTLFCIASNTKAFTAASLALLVDEGRVSWDDPVVRHLPGFQMYDPWVTREITIRDLLTHRSGLGLGQGDLMTFPPTTFTRAEIVYNQRFLKPATSFRSRYAYDNLLYIVAAEIVAAVTGDTWEHWVQQRLFAPVGMTGTYTSAADFRPDAVATAAHVRDEDGQIVAAPYVHGENSIPAGGIYANARDMARWVQTHLAGGLSPDGVRVFSEAQSREMWTPQSIIPADSLALPPAHFRCYGLGWRISDYAGHKVVAHNGQVMGMVSRVTIVPERGIGIVVLTNLEDDDPLHSIVFTTLDRLLDLPPTNWPGAYRAVREREQARAAASATQMAATRADDSTPSLPLAAYAGAYRDDWMGLATLTLEADTLVFRFDKSPGLVGDLSHHQQDTFLVRWRDRALQADTYLTFALRPNGTIDEAKMLPVSPLIDFSYDFQDLLLRRVA